MGTDSLPSTGSSSEPGDRDRSPEIPLAVISAFAHQMRNVLGPVRTAAYLLRASSAGNAQALWALDLVDRQVQAMTASIDELTDLVRLARGTLELAAGPIDLREALDSAAFACSEVLAERRQTLDWMRPGERIVATGDRDRLVQAFAGLLRTTFRDAPAKARIRVQLTRQASAAVAIIESVDPGPSALASPANDGAAGAAPASVELALAQAIVEQLGGVLSVGGASRFEVRLPLADLARSP